MSVAEKGKEWLPEQLGGTGGKGKYGPEEELRDFLNMVASSELTIPSDVDPSKPLERDVYVVDLGDVAWLQEVQADHPVIVFSKVRLSLTFVLFYADILVYRLTARK